MLPLHVDRVDLYINEPFSLKRELKASAKSIDAGQLAQSAQADLGRKSLLLAICISKVPYYMYFMIHLVDETDSRISKEKACMTFRSNDLMLVCSRPY